jgi:DNA-binding MarR family transcriptional regulator
MAVSCSTTFSSLGSRELQPRGTMDGAILSDWDDSEFRDVTRQLGYLLRISQSNVWRDLVATFQPFSIKPQQYAAMALIEAAPNATLEGLAQKLGIKTPNLVAPIDDLVNRDLVTRVRSKQDRRVMVLGLTPVGMALLQELKAADDTHNLRLATALGEGGARRLVQMLSKLVAFNSGDDGV